MQCERCNGKSFIYDYVIPDMPYGVAAECPDCKGTGEKINREETTIVEMDI